MKRGARRIAVFLLFLVSLGSIAFFGVIVHAVGDLSKTTAISAPNGWGLSWQFDTIRENEARKATTTFVLAREFSHVSVSVQVWGEMPGESVIATLHGPDKTYEPWLVRSSECHRIDGCSNPGAEWIVIVRPPLGNYTLELTPGPGSDKLPQQHLAPPGVTGFDHMGYYSKIGGSGISWYYPDGTKVVKNGGGLLENPLGLMWLSGLCAAASGGSAFWIWRRGKALRDGS